MSNRAIRKGNLRTKPTKQERIKSRRKIEHNDYISKSSKAEYWITILEGMDKSPHSTIDWTKSFDKIKSSFSDNEELLKFNLYLKSKQNI